MPPHDQPGAPEPSASPAVAGASHPYSPPVDDLSPGSTLGQYRILARLGSGGMGQVFKAVHPAMDRVVAIKVLAPQLLQNDRARARFRQEVRSAARLAHPHIVTAHDAAEDRGHSFLVMEHVEGTDLGTLVVCHGPPSVPVACEIIRQAALALQHAYEQGMVHRDIKPSNLMVTGIGERAPEPARSASEEAPTPDPRLSTPLQVKVLDFGVARLAAAEPEDQSASPSALTREGWVVGTPEFMAPEQARDSRRADSRSDIYSLGCTFYFLLTGRPPFAGGTPVDLVVRHSVEPPQPVNRLRAEVPDALARVVHRMMAKDPADRYAEPGEVATALIPWCGCSLSEVGSGERRNGRAGLDKPNVILPTRRAPSGMGLRLWMAALPVFLIGFLATVLVASFFRADADEDQALRNNSLGMAFARFPAASFRRLSDPPGQTVTFTRGFDVAATEVTRGQFRRFVAATRYRTVAERSRGELRGSRMLMEDGTWQPVGEAFWDSPLLEPEEDVPVVCVSWEDAVHFCNWLSDAERRKKCYFQRDKALDGWECDFTADGYRLPTSAEWEYFARAGSLALLPAAGEISEHGWFRENADGRPHPAGQKRANPRKLHDVWGNVWEWCWDWHATAAALPEATDPTGPPAGTHRTARGGGWSDAGADLADNEPKGLPADYRAADLGFRVVRTVTRP